MGRSKKIFISLGDLSADQIVSSVIDVLNSLEENFECVGFGGDLIQKSGVFVYENTVQSSSVGLPFSKLFYFSKLFRRIVKRMAEFVPDILFLSDWGMMNLTLAKKARELFGKRVKILFYPSPQVWLWRSYRIKKLEKYVDYCALLYPVEYDFYFKQKVQLSYRCVGHPFTDKYRSVCISQNKEHCRVALFPGSRSHLIQSIWPLWIQFIQSLPSHLVYSVCVPSFLQSYVKSLIPLNYRSRISVSSSVEQTFCQSHVAVGCMGTILLESVYFEVPIVGFYNIPDWVYMLFKKPPYFTLPNLLMKEYIIPEVIGRGSGASKMSQVRDWVLLLLNNPNIYQRVQENLKKLKQNLMNIGSPSQSVARMIKEIC